MDLDYLKFSLVAVSYAAICAIYFSKVLRGPERAIAASFSVFFFFFNAFGVSDANTDISLLPKFIISIAFFLLGAWFGSVLARRAGVTVFMSDHTLRQFLAKHRGASIIVSTFISLSILELTFPEFRLHLLFSLPELDIRQWFERRLMPEQRGAISYFLILMVPLYYLALSHYIKSWWVVLFLLLLPIYFGFVKEGYIGRYEIAVKILIYWLYLWFFWPKTRVTLLLLTVAGLPFLLLAFNVFAFVRLGVPFADAIYIAGNNVVAVLESEVTFLQVSGNTLIESGRSIDLQAYFIWLLTLPLPGFLKTGLPISLVNFEISEIVLGLRVADQGFFVLLPGLLAESIFLYGGLFFIHFLFLGVLGGVVSQISGRSGCMFFLHLFFIVSFGLVLNRGGIASLAPHIFTEPIFFVFLLLFIIYWSQQTRKGMRR